MWTLSAGQVIEMFYTQYTGYCMNGKLADMDDLIARGLAYGLVDPLDNGSTAFRLTAKGQEIAGEIVDTDFVIQVGRLAKR